MFQSDATRQSAKNSPFITLSRVVRRDGIPEDINVYQCFPSSLCTQPAEDSLFITVSWRSSAAMEFQKTSMFANVFRAVSARSPRKTHYLSLFPGVVRRDGVSEDINVCQCLPSGLCTQPAEDSLFITVSWRRPQGWSFRRHQCLPMSSERSLHAARGRLTIYHCFLASSAGWISEDINVYQCFPSSLCTQPAEDSLFITVSWRRPPDGFQKTSMFTNVLEQTRTAAITTRARILQLCSPRPKRFRGALFENF